MATCQLTRGHEFQTLVERGKMKKVNSRGQILDITPSSERIESLPEVARYISTMELDQIRESLTNLYLPNIVTLTPERARRCEYEYRRWLFLRRKYEGEILPPGKDIDMTWHAYILDTVAYRKDCDRIFGYYFDHNPYFGGESERDAKRLRDAFGETMKRYKETYGYDPRYPH